MKYDYLIIGSGFFGSICANELNKRGNKCLVIEKRNHIGGNCYTSNKDNINVHQYGAHIFHTSDIKIWNYVNNITNFNNYKHHVLGNFKGEIYSLPFNMFTFNKLWGVNTPEEAKIKIESQSIVTDNPLNFEEQAISTIGRDIYEKLIKGYSQKQWRKDPKDLPKEIIKRLPIRYTWDNNYYHDTYQGIPIGGYTQIFEKLLNGIEVRLSTDYFDNREYFNSISKKIIYTGAIDKFYDYKFGHLEYKTVNFEHKYISHTDNFQGCSVMNYTDLETPYTRIIEHKHFENNQTNGTWVTWEYPIEYDAKRTEAYYPVNDRVNNEKYNSYKELSNKESNIFFGGRLAEYKYYDMDDIIESALRFIENHIK